MKLIYILIQSKYIYKHIIIYISFFLLSVHIQYVRIGYLHTHNTLKKVDQQRDKYR